ncbi:hypothetical protein AB1N83_006542 [Pleurotus pulmonarius]
MFGVNINDIKNGDKVIAIMGPTGAGKSTGGRRAGHALKPFTADIEAVRYNDGKENIVFVDTPCFDDTTRSDTETLKLIANWLEKTYRKHILLTGIIYELVDLHKVLRETQAGKPLYGEILPLLVEQKRVALQLREEVSKQSQTNPALRAELDNQFKQIDGLLNTTLIQIQEMKIPFVSRLKSFFSFKKAAVIVPSQIYGKSPTSRQGLRHNLRSSPLNLLSRSYSLRLTSTGAALRNCYLPT